MGSCFWEYKKSAYKGTNRVYKPIFLFNNFRLSESCSLLKKCVNFDIFLGFAKVEMLCFEFYSNLTFAEK